MLGLAFAILNSWTALSASLSLALPSGGPEAVIWGLITAGICNLCLAASLAEFLSAYPTAGGQYHWVAVISWKPWVPILSWITGWINVSGWIALVASGGLLGSQLIVGCISFYNSSYEPQRWWVVLLRLQACAISITFLFHASQTSENDQIGTRLCVDERQLLAIYITYSSCTGISFSSTSPTI